MNWKTNHNRATFSPADEGGGGGAPAGEPAAEGGEAAPGDATGEPAPLEPTLLGDDPPPAKTAEEIEAERLAAEALANETPEAKAAREAAEAEAAKTAAPKFEVVAPEGMEIDAEALEAAAPIFADLGVTTTEQAQAVLDKFAPIISGIVAKAVAANQVEQVEALERINAAEAAQWAVQTRAMPSMLAGEGFEANIDLAKRGRDEFASPELKALLTSNPIGSHPAVVDHFRKLGAEMSDGTWVKPNQEPAPKSDAATMYPEYVKPG